MKTGPLETDFAALATGSPCRILQVADLHSDVEEALNERTRADIRALVTHCRPHLIVANGDIWCGDEHPDAAPMWMQRDIAFLGSLDTPWVFVRGNHDCCADFDRARAMIAAAPNAIAPQGDGKGAFRIEVHRRGAPGAVCWDLFFLNSGPSWNIPEDLLWFESESARIAAERGRITPAAAFFHIPLKNYQDAMDAGRVTGIGVESVLGWGDDEGRAAPILKRPGNLRLCVSAHSHRNDYYFVEDGIRFVSGRATGHGGYGVEDLRKGATLVELSLESDEATTKTVFADGSVWNYDAP